MTPLVSICVPVYNSEEYIDQCLESLFQQTYTNIEYVFVNDCSTDNSLQKLQEYRDRYSKAGNVKIISNDANMGVAITRIRCLQNATGEYITMVDSDDYVDSNYVEHLVDCALKNNADMVCCPVVFKTQNGEHIHYFKEIAPNDDLLQLFFQDDIFSCVAKLYHKSIFTTNNLYVPNENLRTFEDKWILLAALYIAKRAVVTNEVKYYYRYNPDSLSHQKFEEKHFVIMQTYWSEVDKFLTARNFTGKYAELVALRKTDDKVLLMLQPIDIRLKKKYADLYRKEQYIATKNLKGAGFRIMSFLIYHHLFFLVRLYDCLNVVFARIKR